MLIGENYTVGDIAILCADIYHPKVEFFHPEFKKKTADNLPDKYGFYSHSLLKKTHGWIRLKETMAQANGFYAAYYIKHRCQSQGVIVFRGSDDFYDFAYHDLKIASGEWPKVHIDARNFYNLIKKLFNPSYLIFAGHSLGGALAQIVAREVNAVRTEKILFPAVCFNAPQMGYLFEYNFKMRATTDLEEFIYKYKKKFDQVAHGLLIEKILSGPELIHSVFKYLRKIYQKIMPYKNLSLGPKYGEAGYNGFYYFVTANPQQDKNHFAQAEGFRASIRKFSAKYSYIYNFNSCLDLVHTCGIALGNNYIIDIDHKNNHDSWQEDYYNSHCYYSRLRYDLRILLSMQDDYLQNIHPVLKIKGKYKIKYLKLDSTVSNKIHLSLLEILCLGAHKALPINDYNAVHYRDLVYLLDTQHSIYNLTKVISNNKNLTSIRVGLNLEYINRKIKNYYRYTSLIDYHDGIDERIVDLVYKLKGTKNINYYLNLRKERPNEKKVDLTSTMESYAYVIYK